VESVRTRLRMKCKARGYWNRIEVDKLFIEQPYSGPQVRSLFPCMNRSKLRCVENAKAL
jgi:hypothetical protein